MKRVSLQVLLALVLTTLALAPAAHGAYPGQNGKIAFTSERDGNSEIYVMNADGSGQTRLTNNPSTDRDPAWSPDGTEIALPPDATATSRSTS